MPRFTKARSIKSTANAASINAWPITDRSKKSIEPTSTPNSSPSGDLFGNDLASLFNGCGKRGVSGKWRSQQGRKQADADLLEALDRRLAQVTRELAFGKQEQADKLAAEEKALEEKKRAKEDAAEQLERDLAAAADQLAQMASC